MKVDYSKISDATALVPPLDSHVVRRILKVAFDHWVSAHTYIDPNRRRGRAADKLRLGDSDELLSYIRTMDRDEPIFALTELLSTPRHLKRLVAEVDRAWTRLKGEAELIDIIVVHALRQTAEPVIDFLYRNIDVARQKNDRFGLKGANAPDPIADEWRELLSTLENPGAVQSLVDLIGIERLTGRRGRADATSLQDVSRYYPTDYFRRILFGDIGKNEIRDQTVLSDIHEWRRRSNDTMIVKLVNADEDNDQYVRVWEYFAATEFTAADFPTIATAIHGRILSRQGTTLLFQKAPACTAVWRLMRNGPRDRRNEWLIREIRSALPISLLFASDLYAWYGSIPHGIVSTDGRALVRAALVSAAHETFAGRPAFLVRSLGEDQPYALTRFITPPPTDEPPDTIRLADLRWFAEIVTDAARIAPAIVLPDIAVTFGRFGDHFEREGDEGPQLVQTYTLERSRFLEFFDARTDEMISVMAAFDSRDPVLLDAQQQAREWQRERRHANPQ